MKHGIGVHADYKKQAQKGCDVLFHVKIKGRSTLVDDIPLHMSLKIFGNPKEFDLNEMKQYVKKHDICSPNPKTLTFKPIIFTAEFSGLDYYMLKIQGLPQKYKDFYLHYKDVGNVYKNFMTHVTIDKALYEDLKENGVKPEDIEFGPLVLEHGAGNTEHTFKKSEYPDIYDSQKILKVISSIKNPEIFIVKNGESAVGKYHLTPEIIRDTIHMNPDLKVKYGQAMNIRGDDMRRYIEDNPRLEEEVAQKHLERLEHHFGKNIQKIVYAWTQGIANMYKAEKNKENIENHWHVKRFKNAYEEK